MIPTNLTRLILKAMGQILSLKKGTARVIQDNDSRKVKELTITDNHGFIIGPITVKPVNEHETTILPEVFTKLITLFHRIGRDLSGNALTLVSGFDAKEIIG